MADPTVLVGADGRFDRDELAMNLRSLSAEAKQLPAILTSLRFRPLAGSSGRWTHRQTHTGTMGAHCALRELEAVVMVNLAGVDGIERARELGFEDE